MYHSGPLIAALQHRAAHLHVRRHREHLERARVLFVEHHVLAQRDLVRVPLRETPHAVPKLLRGSRVKGARRCPGPLVRSQGALVDGHVPVPRRMSSSFLFSITMRIPLSPDQAFVVHDCCAGSLSVCRLDSPVDYIELGKCSLWHACPVPMRKRTTLSSRAYLLEGRHKGLGRFICRFVILVGSLALVDDRFEHRDSDPSDAAACL